MANYTRMRIAAIIPAHNEAGRISAVLNAVLGCPDVARAIVVDDGSADNTSEVAGRFPCVEVIVLPVNRGKGGAMLAGALSATDVGAVVFLDADLIGLTPDHVSDLIAPVLSGKAEMALGKFVNGRGLTDLAQRIAPNITGQRAILRDLFLSVPDLEGVGFGVELAVTTHVHDLKRPVATVKLRGVTHPMKEEKLGRWRGMKARMRMYYEMGRYRFSHGHKHHGPPPTTPQQSLATRMPDSVESTDVREATYSSRPRGL